MSMLGVRTARAGPEARASAPPPTRVDVKSHRFGAVAVPSDRILRFVRPVVGFQDITEYAVIEDEESAPLLWIQALGAPEVLLPVVDAGLVNGGYSVELADEEVAALGLQRAEDARLLVVLTLSPDPSAITANLRAPIVWNTRGATAMQLVLQDAAFSFSHPVGGAGRLARANKEVARACPDTPEG